MYLIEMVGEYYCLSRSFLLKKVNKPDFGNTAENIWLRVNWKETDVLSLLWMAGQLEEENDVLLIQIIKQVQEYDLVVIRNLNYPDIC